MSKLVMNAARCKKCNVVCISTHVHDLRECKCKSMFVDGGNEYIRRGFKDVEHTEEMSLYKWSDGYIHIGPEKENK